jgi:hypothetical protein
VLSAARVDADPVRIDRLWHPVGMGCHMDVGEEKVDDIALVLLYVAAFEDKPRLRAWKGHNRDALDRLIGRITSPIQQRKRNQPHVANVL